MSDAYDDDDDDLRTLALEEIRSVAEILVRCGLPLLHPEALETDHFYDLEGVLHACTKDGQHAFGFTLFFDSEMIYGEDDYPSLIRDIAHATNQTELLTHASSRFSDDGHEISVNYTFGEISRNLTFDQRNDWIPDDVLQLIFDDIGSVPGRVRLTDWDGQGGMVVWISPEHVDDFFQLDPEFEIW